VEISSSLVTYQGKQAILSIARNITERKQMEKVLGESEEKYRTQFEEALDAIFVADAETGIIIDCNRAATKLVGREKSEIIGNHQRILHPPEVIKGKFSKTSKQHRKEKEGQVLETQVITKNGEIKDVAIKANVLELRGKKLIQGIFRDITEGKSMEERLLESEERLRNLYESIPDSLAVFVGREGHLLEYNKAFKKRTGYTDEELKDKTFLDFVYPDDRAMILKKYRTRYPEEELPLVFELREINKKGEALPTEVSVSTYKKKGRVIGIEVMHRDITKRKEMEKKLQEYAAHLEEMVEERTKELKEVHEQLLKAERLAAIGELAAMVGHDLRNPLTGIAGATYYLKRKLGSKTKKKTREMLELIEKDIEHSNKIISDLLEYSRELRLELAETTPKTIVEEAFSLVEVPKNIQVLDSTQSEPKVKVDMEKIKRVFANLIKNAIEAMPKGGKLTLKSKETNGRLEIAFTDTGVGIPKNNLEKIGKPLFTTKSKGIGLGLSICKRIVEAHRGNISVESTVGKGTTFTVTIPIEPELEGGEKIWVKPLESSLLTTTKT